MKSQPSSPFSEDAPQSSFRSAYTPQSQGREANTAFGRQTAATAYSRRNPNYTAKKMGRGKKIAIGVVAAVLVAAICGGTAFALYINSINNQIQRGTKTQEELNALADVLVPTKSFTEPFYMMLIGSDKRGEGSSIEGARSDTNIVVRVDPSQNLATLVSIPRDTMIEIDGYGINKFNAAYNYGGAAGAITEASQLLDVEISHYAEVNFEELVELVDAVGGVDVVVDERIDDADAGDVVIETGEQHLDGEAALVFARSRAFEDGDFTRTDNQRKLIMALVNKVLELPVTELPGVIQNAANCVTTDLSVSDIISLAQQFKDQGDLTVYSAMAPTVFMDQLVNGQSYVLNDPTATAQMMKLVEAGEDPSGIEGAQGVGPGGYTSSSGGAVGGGGTYSYDDGFVDEGAGYEEGYDPSYDESYNSTPEPEPEPEYEPQPESGTNNEGDPGTNEEGSGS